MTGLVRPERDEVVHSLATLAIAQAEMDSHNQQILALLAPFMSRYGLNSPEGFQDIAKATLSIAPDPTDMDWVAGAGRARSALEDAARRVALR
jgi:hypothetical protein